MRQLFRMLALALMLVVGFSFTNAEAAPAGAGLTPLKAATQAPSAVEKTYWVRRCHRTRYGVRCHRVWVKPYRPHRHYRPYRRYRRW
jgi:hypothetical protein